MTNTRCLRRSSWIWSAVVLLTVQPASAITLGQIDDFEDGTIANWKTPGGFVTFTNVNDAGPMGAGDNALNADIPSRLVITNDMQWAGNYVAAGVTQISLDLRHQYNFPLAMRIGIGNGPISPGGTGDTYVTNYSLAAPNDGQWHHLVFNVSAGNFEPSDGNSPPSDAAAALANVTHFRLLHNPTPMDFRGDFAAGTLQVDNIQALGDAPADDADFDGDNDVDGQDFLIWQRGLGVGTTLAAGDADGNGMVDAADLAVWKSQFGGGASVAAVGAVPEPSGLALIGMVALGTRCLLGKRSHANAQRNKRRRIARESRE
jgi:hypothetical protein